MTHQIQLLDDGSVLGKRRNVVGRVALIPEATLDTVRRGAHALGSVPGHLLIRGLILQSNDAYNSNASEPRRVVFENGWSGMLETLRINPKYHSRMKDIAIAGQCIVWSTPYATVGGLWTWSDSRGTRASSGKVTFVLGDALAPGHAAELAQTSNFDGARRARRLVPELRQPPPTRHAHESVRGALWTLHRVLMVEFVDRADELHTRGAVVINLDRWLELANQACVAREVVEPTLDAWVEGDDEAPPLLQRLGDEWTLADAHAPEREFIASGGAKRIRGRMRGSRRRR